MEIKSLKYLALSLVFVLLTGCAGTGGSVKSSSKAQSGRAIVANSEVLTDVILTHCDNFSDYFYSKYFAETASKEEKGIIEAQETVFPEKALKTKKSMVRKRLSRLRDSKDYIQGDHIMLTVPIDELGSYDDEIGGLELLRAYARWSDHYGYRAIVAETLSFANSKLRHGMFFVTPGPIHRDAVRGKNELLWLKYFLADAPYVRTIDYSFSGNYKYGDRPHHFIEIIGNENLANIRSGVNLSRTYAGKVVLKMGKNTAYGLARAASNPPLTMEVEVNVVGCQLQLPVPVVEIVEAKISDKNGQILFSF